MVGGPIASTYYYNTALTTRGMQGAPYIDDTGSYPAWADVTWASAQTLDTILVIAAPPWQEQGTLLDFDVQYLLADGVTWQTAETITEPSLASTVSDPNAVSFPFVTYKGDVGCSVEQFFSGRYVFYVRLGAAVSTKGVRVFIRNATYGGNTNALENEVLTHLTAFGKNFTLRQISAYNSATPHVTAMLKRR
jgi:hypothetical protein